MFFLVLITLLAIVAVCCIGFGFGLAVFIGMFIGSGSNPFIGAITTALLGVGYVLLTVWLITQSISGWVIFFHAH